MQNSIYNPISLEVGNILKDVQTGKIGLPDLQRPFVWGNEKVRDLLDSMLRGYPIGYVMLWDSPSDNAGKKTAIGSNQKVYTVPKSLVIDGQQRLTALLSSLYGVSVRDKNFRERTVKVAYDPIARSFKNADASTEKDSRYVPDVSEAFAANHDNKLSAYRRAFIKRLNEANAKKGEPELDDDGEDAVESGLNALLGLERYLLPTLEISESADEETVSDIFVRVNSQGQALKQDDFIMTLLSVYEPAMRERIEEFCAMSHAPAKGTSYNPLMTVSPTHIIRATVGVGFKRGRLRLCLPDSSWARSQDKGNDARDASRELCHVRSRPRSRAWLEQLACLHQHAGGGGLRLLRPGGVGQRAHVLLCVLPYRAL